MIEFSLPVAPSVNVAYYYRGGKRLKNARTKAYDRIAIAKVKKLVGKKKYFFKPDRKIICELMFYFPDRRRRDTHNNLKILFDAIEMGGLYKDDRYVIPRVIDFDVDRENPRIEMKFYYFDKK